MNPRQPFVTSRVDCCNVVYAMSLQTITARRIRLRSANLNRLTIPFLAADLEHAGPTVWNSLRDELTDSDSSDGFK